MLKDKNSKTKIFNFISKHRFPAKYLEDFKTDSDYFEYMRKFEMDTLKGEKVKSFEELLIADWLFLNGVYYEQKIKQAFNLTLVCALSTKIRLTLFFFK